MVVYSLGDRARTKIYIWIAIAALVISAGAFPWLGERLGIPLGSIKLGAFHDFSLPVFGVMLYLFDRFGWKLPGVIHGLGLTDLNGTWLGTLERTSFVDGAEEKDIPVYLEIEQRYRHMSFRLKNDEDSSMSNRSSSASSLICLSGSRAEGFILQEGFRTDDLFGVSKWEIAESEGRKTMACAYVSNFPRKGRIHLRRFGRNDRLVNAEIHRMRDSSGLEYLGLQVRNDIAKYFYRQMKGKVGSSQKALRLARNRSARDGHHHHVTVVSPTELSSLDTTTCAPFENAKVLIGLWGIGRARSGESEAYYALAYSPDVDFLRKKAGLPPKDLHMTLGFEPEDVHDVRKNADSLI